MLTSTALYHRRGGGVWGWKCMYIYTIFCIIIHTLNYVSTHTAKNTTNNTHHTINTKNTKNEASALLSGSNEPAGGGYVPNLAQPPCLAYGCYRDQMRCPGVFDPAGVFCKKAYDRSRDQVPSFGLPPYPHARSASHPSGVGAAAALESQPRLSPPAIGFLLCIGIGDTPPSPLSWVKLCHLP